MIRMLLAVALGVSSLAAVRAASSQELHHPRSSFVPPRGANVVTVVAREYAFDMPASIPAGLTSFILHGEGAQPHHIMLFRLDRGKTLSDAFHALTLTAALPPWMHAVGGPNSPAPGGGVSNGTVMLEPGEYVVFCMVPSPDGAPHFAKGMVRGLTVRASARGATTLPTGDITLTLRDYDFVFSTPPTRGHHTIVVTNTGRQPHEVILSRLAPGKTSRDFVRWIETQEGPPPVTPFGGTTDIPPGGAILIEVDLEPGSYSLLCRVRDVRDGKPHDAHGMSRDFVVE
jgi:hypothetical protein